MEDLLMQMPDFVSNQGSPQGPVGRHPGPDTFSDTRQDQGSTEEVISSKAAVIAAPPGLATTLITIPNSLDVIGTEKSGATSREIEEIPVVTAGPKPTASFSQLLSSSSDSASFAEKLKFALKPKLRQSGHAL